MEMSKKKTKLQNKNTETTFLALRMMRKWLPNCVLRLFEIYFINILVLATYHWPTLVLQILVLMM